MKTSLIKESRAPSRSYRLRLSRILSSTIRSLSDLIAEQGAKVSYEPSKSEYFVFSNRDKVRRTMKSLLYQAIKLAGQNGIVVIREQRMQGRRRVDKADLCKVTLCVSGSAVSEEMLEVLSERFQQINRILINGQSDSHDFLLADCRRFIREAGGNIWVKSNHDDLIFNITLPVIKEIKLDGAQGRKQKISVVEGNPSAVAEELLK